MCPWDVTRFAIVARIYLVRDLERNPQAQPGGAANLRRRELLSPLADLHVASLPQERLWGHPLEGPLSRDSSPPSAGTCPFLQGGHDQCPTTCFFLPSSFPSAPVISCVVLRFGIVPTYAPVTHRDQGSNESPCLPAKTQKIVGSLPCPVSSHLVVVNQPV